MTDAASMPPASPPLIRSRSRFRAGGGLWTLAAALGMAVLWLLLLESLAAANVLISRAFWQDLVHGLGGRAAGRGGEATAAVPFLPLWGLATLLGVAGWLAGAWLIAWRSGGDFRTARQTWGKRSALWSLVAAGWGVPWFVALAANWSWGASVML